MKQPTQTYVQKNKKKTKQNTNIIVGHPMPINVIDKIHFNWL